MKNKKWLILYGMVMLCVAAWLLFSSKIILTLSGMEQVKSCEHELAGWGTDEVYCSIDYFYIANDLYESVGVTGWAFAATTEENEDRKTYFIFQGDSNSYQYEVKIPEDRGVQFYQQVIYRGPTLTALLGVDNSNPKLGFAGDFSTIGMKDGIYEFYIACWENEEVHGIKSTDIWIKKEGSKIEQIDASTQKIKQIEEKIATEEEACTSIIDVIRAKGESLAVIGWAFVPEMDAGTQKVYLEVRDKGGERSYYACDTQYMREDVGTAFGDVRYNKSGFDIYIPVPETEDAWQARILVENGEKIWASNPYTVSKSSEGYKIAANSELDSRGTE